MIPLLLEAFVSPDNILRPPQICTAVTYVFVTMLIPVKATRSYHQTAQSQSQYLVSITVHIPHQ